MEPSKSSRRSYSLQDLRSISAAADLEACIDNNSSSSSSRPWNFSRTSSKLYKGGNSNSSNSSSSSTGHRVLTGILVVSLVVALFYVGFLWGREHWSQEQMHFAIVMDCGSTSTRVYVYGWIHNGRSIPVVYRPPSHNDNAQLSDKSKQKAYHRMETEPGFHHLLHNETGLRNAVQPLLDWAKQQIPTTSHSETPLFLLGTAGLRKMATVDSEWLLDKTWGIVEKSPFQCRRSWLRIITGAEEAYYGWVALNYVLERLGRGNLATVGSLDLGGSSLEVTFEPDKPVKQGYGVNLSIGREQHHLYAYSHAGFGLNDAFDKSVALLMQKRQNFTITDGVVELKHPCLHTQYRQKYSCSSYCVSPPSTARGEEGALQMELVGEPNWQQCQLLARSVVNSSRRSSECEHSRSSCALGKYQPVPKGQFSAVAGFFVMYKFFGLSSKASLDDLLQKGQQFCEMPWPAAMESVKPQDFIDRYCFRAPYVVSLLRDGLHLTDDQITVGPGDITWTQGAALIESGILGRRMPQRKSWFGSPSSTPLPLNAPLPTLLVVILVLVILLTVSCYRQRRSYTLLPYEQHKSSPGNGHSKWLPNFTRNLRVAGSGDVRVKAPHSPAPSAAKHSLQELQPSRMLGAANVPLLLEADMLRLPPPGPGAAASRAKMQLKGGSSRLQSRRTPSKEDLNSSNL